MSESAGTSLVDRRRMTIALSRARWLKPTELRVALALLAHANMVTGQCNPSHERIAKGWGVDAREVARAIRGLEAKGVLRVERSKNRTNRYSLPVNALQTDALGLPCLPAAGGETPHSSNEVEGVKLSMLGGRNCPPHPRGNSPCRGRGNPPPKPIKGTY
jgi:hypothetical protein